MKKQNEEALTVPPSSPGKPGYPFCPGRPWNRNKFSSRNFNWNCNRWKMFHILLHLILSTVFVSDSGDIFIPFFGTDRYWGSLCSNGDMSVSAVGFNMLNCGTTVVQFLELLLLFFRFSGTHTVHIRYMYSLCVYTRLHNVYTKTHLLFAAVN